MSNKVMVLFCSVLER